MERLTLHFPNEDGPRMLCCRLLQPNEQHSAVPMTQEQLSEVFSGSRRSDEAPHDEAPHDEAQDEDSEHSCHELAEENDQEIEAMNVIPQEEPPAHDGEMPELAEPSNTAPHTLDRFVPAADPMVEFVAAFDATAKNDWDDEALYQVDEELCYEPASKSEGTVAPSSPVVMSEDAGSSKDKFQGQSQGLGKTPTTIRSMLPPGAGVKLQHKLPATPGRCPGWQAWADAIQPSRWFSYTCPHAVGRFQDREAALQAAMAWLWEEYEKSKS